MCASAASRVLIVEDDGAVRGFLGRALESGGYVPVPVRTGEEALQLLRAGEPMAAVLIDGILPDMHGLRLADSILDSPSGADIAICFVTGALRETAPAVAGIGALSKPLRLAELLGFLDVLMRWRAAGGSAAADRREALRRMEQAFLVGP